METRNVLVIACIFGLAIGQIPGGYIPMNSNDPKLYELAWWVTRQLGSNLVLAGIDSGRQAVVAGMNYELVIRLFKVNPFGRPYWFRRCTVTVYENLQNVKRITDLDCRQTYRPPFFRGNVER